MNYTPHTSKIKELQFMFEAQTKIVCSLELEKIEMQKKIDLLKEEKKTLQGNLNEIFAIVQKEVDSVQKEIDLLKEEKKTLQGNLNKIFAIECPSKRSAEVSRQKIKRIGIS